LFIIGQKRPCTGEVASEMPEITMHRSRKAFIMAIGRLMLTVLIKEDSRMSSALMAMQDNGTMPGSAVPVKTIVLLEALPEDNLLASLYIRGLIMAGGLL
jgi:hypothetical protein